MFTRMSKVVLWILLVVCVIAGFILLGVDPAISFIVWGGGLVLVYGFGIFVELINNVLDIKKILKKMSDNGYSMGASVQQMQAAESQDQYNTNQYNQSQHSSNQHSQNQHSSNQYNQNQYSSAQYSQSQYAQNRSRQSSRNEGRLNLSAAAAASTSQSEIKAGWYCRACGTKNKPASRMCIGCGKER